MNSHSLCTLIEQRITLRWSEWAKHHPHLAEAIDRIRLTESAVDQLRNDPDFIAAMRETDLDEAGLIRAAQLLDRADNIIHRLLP